MLGGERGGGRNGVLGGVNYLSEDSGAGRSHDGGCRLLVVGELLSQAISLSLDLAHRQVSSVHCQPPTSLFLVSVFT